MIALGKTLDQAVLCACRLDSVSVQKTSFLFVMTFTKRTRYYLLEAFSPLTWSYFLFNLHLKEGYLSLQDRYQVSLQGTWDQSGQHNESFYGTCCPVTWSSLCPTDLSWMPVGNELTSRRQASFAVWEQACTASRRGAKGSRRRAKGSEGYEVWTRTPCTRILSCGRCLLFVSVGFARKRSMASFCMTESQAARRTPSCKGGKHHRIARSICID